MIDGATRLWQRRAAGAAVAASGVDVGAAGPAVPVDAVVAVWRFEPRVERGQAGAVRAVSVPLEVTDARITRANTSRPMRSSIAQLCRAGAVDFLLSADARDRSGDSACCVAKPMRMSPAAPQRSSVAVGAWPQRAFSVQTACASYVEGTMTDRVPRELPISEETKSSLEAELLASTLGLDPIERFGCGVGLVDACIEMLDEGSSGREIVEAASESLNDLRGLPQRTEEETSACEPNAVSVARLFQCCPAPEQALACGICLICCELNLVSARTRRLILAFLTLLCREFLGEAAPSEAEPIVRAMEDQPTQGVAMKWKIEVVRSGRAYRWKLFNRHGDLVMVSREAYPSHELTIRAVEYEKQLLRDLAA